MGVSFRDSLSGSPSRMLSATYLDIQSKCGSTLPYLILEFVPGMKPASKGCFFLWELGMAVKVIIAPSHKVSGLKSLYTAAENPAQSI